MPTLGPECHVVLTWSALGAPILPLISQEASLATQIRWLLGRAWKTCCSLQPRPSSVTLSILYISVLLLNSLTKWWPLWNFWAIDEFGCWKEYPKPVVPNMVFIGGINCVYKNPLSLVGMKANGLPFFWASQLIKIFFPQCEVQAQYFIGHSR